MVDLLEVSELTVDYKTNYGTVRAVDAATLRIPTTGYSLGLVGESGCGKTTMGMSIMNLIEPPGKIARGRVLYKGEDVLKMRHDELKKFRWQEISMVYQSAMNSLNPVKTV